MARPITITIPASSPAATHAVLRTSVTINGTKSAATVVALSTMGGYTGTFPEDVTYTADVSTLLYLHVSLALGVSGGDPVGEGTAVTLFPITGDPALVTLYFSTVDVGLGTKKGVSLSITPVNPFLYGSDLVAYQRTAQTDADGEITLDVPAQSYKFRIEGLEAQEVDLSGYGGLTYNVGTLFV